MEIFVVLYIIVIALIAEIDRRHIKIEKNILIFGIIGSMIYMIYLYAVNLKNIYWLALYLGIYMVLIFVDTFLLRRYAKNSYIINVLTFLNVMFVFTELEITIYTIAMAILAIIIYVMKLKMKQKKNGNKKIKFNEIPLGFFIGASNISIFVMMIVIECCIK